MEPLAHPVQVTRHPLAIGGYLAQLTLNSPRTINALRLDTVQALLAELDAIAADEEAAAVWLDGAGERGFCAGGDVRAMRESALANPGRRALAAERFFEIEYRADYRIHTFPKPVLCWSHGITMGGGLGLLIGADHRVVTESTRLAMPEITIGLYPDVGASWFLHRMPGHSGLFCALTGAHLNAGDALYAGLADYLLPEASRDGVLAALLELDWQFDKNADNEMLTGLLTDLEADRNLALPASALRHHRVAIEQIAGRDSLEAIAQGIANCSGDDWLGTARNTFMRGSASTACLIHRQLAESRTLSLPEAFQLEMVLSANRVCDPEFIEGVRAQLVDKDRDPKWAYRSVAEVPQAEIERLFTPCWPQNPLHDL